MFRKKFNIKNNLLNDFLASLLGLELKILIIFGRVRTVHCKLTSAHINDLGAGDVFAPTTTAPCSPLNRPYSRVSTIFKHQVFDRHFTDVTAMTIKHEMILVDWP